MERVRDFYNSPDSPIQFYDAGGTMVLRQRFPNASGVGAQMEAWNGSAWIAVGGTYTDPVVSNPVKLDIRSETQSAPTPSTLVEFYYNGVLFSSGTVNFTIPPIAYFRVIGSFSNNINRYSQFIIADESTINMRFYQRPPTAAGSSAGFSGTFADIDDPALNLTDFISTSNNDAVSTFTAAARPFSGFAIRAVVVSANARRGVAGPQSMQLAIRQGGIDYFGPTIPLTLGFGKYNQLMELNPATSLPWTDSEAGSAALEFGIKSIL